MTGVQERRRALARRIRARELTVAPGVFDMISAKVADRSGFDALYMTGYGIAASHMGLPDAGLVSYSEMVARAACICEATRTPLIADADTGFGGLLNVRHTVRGYEDGRGRRDPDRGSGAPEEMRPRPGPQGGPARRDAAQDRGRCRGARQRRLPHRRAHRFARLPRPRRGDPPGAGVLADRRGRRLHRIAPNRRRSSSASARRSTPPCSPTWSRAASPPSFRRRRSPGSASRSRSIPARAFSPWRRPCKTSTGTCNRAARPSASRSRPSPSAKCTILMGFGAVWEFEKRWGTAETE